MTRGFAAIGLVRPKKEINVGGVMRAAHCFGASLIAIQGVRYKRVASDTTAAWRHIPLLHTDDLFDAVPYDAVPVAVEFIENASCLPQYKHPERAFYVFGPEDGSLGKSVTNRCRDVIQIPTRFCLNLASTVNVVLYDRLAKES